MSSMENNRDLVYLAALLHDIGKFFQRSDTGSVTSSKSLNLINKTESVFCPHKEGNYTHKHVLWTAQFIDDYQSVFNQLINQSSTNQTQDTLLKLAASHHLHKDQLTILGRIIKDADILSSGMDREKDSEFIDNQDSKAWDAFKKKRMTSLLQGINGHNYQRPYHLPVTALDLSYTYFPKQEFDKNPDYGALWQQFITEFKFIQSNSYRAFSETLLNLLYKYTATIPASTVDFPDVSLFDHLKTTAALAVCLHDFQQSGEENKHPFLLIGADISGIQSYIYQIVSKHAGKNLKGRSYYIRLLSDTLVRYLLKQLNLYQANIVYNSGGGFYILAPNTEFTRLALQKAIATIEEHIFKTHGTALFVAIDSVEVSRTALMHTNGEHLGKVWTDLFTKRDSKKNCKLSVYISENYSQFFKPLLNGGENKRDVITGEEFSALDSKQIFNKEKEQYISTTTWQQIELGKLLKQTDYVVVAEEPIPYWKSKFCIEPVGLGFSYYFISDKELLENASKLSASADKVSVITFNGENGNCNFLQTVNGINNIYSLEFYGGNDFKEDEFEKLCSQGSFSRLGVLRMDVDNLGSIFQHGISPDRSTLSRYAALSRSFDYFFSGYLNTIWRETNPHQSFIIYSGGDDLFIIGSWETMIDIAKRIQSDFKSFTCNNPNFTLSGGISLVRDTFPIMKAAEFSDQEEKNAKQHSCGTYSKNSLSFLSTPLHWEFEFPVVEKLKNEIVELVNQKKLNHSFISKILMHSANACLSNHKIQNYRTFWLLTYDLSRLKAREKQHEINKLVDNCIAEICGKKKLLNGESLTTNYHPLELWAFACRWAELEIRSNS